MRAWDANASSQHASSSSLHVHLTRALSSRSIDAIQDSPSRPAEAQKNKPGSSSGFGRFARLSKGIFQIEDSYLSLEDSYTSSDFDEVGVCAG
mmetsp:Transcript_7194/g.44654  ORF Transcript_7194/g.44654 Transcript_7194/m.44654 type:complete len:93 (-) Transcript_7194:1369-1647(-)